MLEHFTIPGDFKRNRRKVGAGRKSRSISRQEFRRLQRISLAWSADPFKCNTLVVYPGGGYSGCIWEPNVAYFDSDYQFHSVYHSGVLGCQTLEELCLRLLTIRKNEYEIFDLDADYDRRTFAAVHSINLVLRTGDWFREYDVEMDLPVPCYSCRNLINVAGYEEAVAYVEGENVLCESCCLICHYCGEVKYPEDFVENTLDPCDYMCQQCAETNKKEVARAYP